MTQEPHKLQLSDRDPTHRPQSVCNPLDVDARLCGASWMLPTNIMVFSEQLCCYLTSIADPLSQLESLPDELLQLIVLQLTTQALKNTALVSKTLYRHATDLLWQNVCLVDQWKLHLNEQTEHLWTERGNGESDEHDDTPILQKLYILAT
jgi:hypothetical protein